jgi:hypothetical protein
VPFRQNASDFVYEQRHQPLLTHRRFLDRLSRHVLAAIGLLAATLAIGMAGYHWLEDLAWIDAYLNASMILSGMGPVAELRTSAGKLFAGTYALFSGLVFVVGLGVVLAPVVHRAFHRFHLDEKE